MTWFRKFAALVLLCLGAALLYLPFPDQLQTEESWEIGAEGARVPWLRPGARVMGTIAVVLGLAAAVVAYRQAAARPGIAVSSGWLVAFCDIIILLGGGFFFTVAIDTLWVGPLGQPSLLGLEPEWVSGTPITGLHFISLPAVFVALPLLTLIFTSLSAQRILVDAECIASFGALWSTRLAWQDLESINVREQKNPAAFTVMDFRKLQTVLDLEGDEVCITINEPSSGRRKGRILRALKEHVPGDKKHLIDEVERQW